MYAQKSVLIPINIWTETEECELDLWLNLLSHGGLQDRVYPTLSLRPRQCMLHSYIIQQALRMFLLKSSHRPSNLQTTTWAVFSAEWLPSNYRSFNIGILMQMFCVTSIWNACKREQWSWPLPCIVLDHRWTLTLCMFWWESILSSYVMHSFSLCCHRSEQRKSDSQTNKFAVLKTTPTFTVC